MAKAGLLTPPPVQRPSHLVSTKQWHTWLYGFLFSKKKGGVTAAGPFPISTGFPIKLSCPRAMIALEHTAPYFLYRRKKMMMSRK